MRVVEENLEYRVVAPEDLAANNAGEFRDSIRKALSDQHKYLTIDCSKTKFIDSSGLGALITLHKLMRTRDGGVRLVQLSPRLEQILELTHLHRIFTIVKE